MRSNFMTFLILAFLIMISGCARGPVSLRFGGDETSSQSQSQSGQSEKPGNEQDIVGFDEVNKKVFQESCAGCHSRVQPILQSYSDYKANLQSVMNEVVVERSMPKRSTLSEEQIALVKKWIEQGGQEKGSGAVIDPAPPQLPPAPVEKITFEKLKTEFFTAKCVSCHDGKEETPDFNSYENVKKKANKIFYEVVIDRAMPPPPEHSESELNPNELSQEQKDLLYRWIRDGMIEK